jgi:hypothetical protein
MIYSCVLFFITLSIFFITIIFNPLVNFLGDNLDVELMLKDIFLWQKD